MSPSFLESWICLLDVQSGNDHQQQSAELTSVWILTASQQPLCCFEVANRCLFHVVAAFELRDLDISNALLNTRIQ